MENRLPADPQNLRVENKEKPHLGVVIVGHVDAGKSTTTGHLLFKLGTMDEREKADIQKVAEAKGKPSFAFAFFMDKQEEERKRGITISCTTKEFHTTNFHFTIIDAPGHKDFIKNMIAGSSQADVALLMVPAKKGNFESAIAKGGDDGKVKGQTRHHAELTNLLGIKQIIIGVNKMDEGSVLYDQGRFKEIKKTMLSMLKSAGWKVKGKPTKEQLEEFKKSKGKGKGGKKAKKPTGPNLVPVIPISGWKGDNLIIPSTNMAWFKQWKATTPSGVEVKGKTLFEALDQFVEPVARGTDRPLRMPLSGIFKTKKGTVITGRIEQGVLVKQITTKTGANPQPVKFFPSGITAKIFSIEAHHRDQPNATAGDNIGVLLKGLPKGIQPKVGEVMCVHPEEKGATAIGKTKSFVVEVKIQEHPGKLKVGYCPLVLVRTAKSACKITKIHWKLTSQAMKNAAKDGKKSVKQMEDYKEVEPKFIQKGDLARITFEPSKESPISVSGFDDCEGLGRVAILESNSLVMMGKIKSVVAEEVKDRTG